MGVKKGDKIKVEYTGTLSDGTVFDSSEKHGKPLEFEVGVGKMIKGFDEAVIGMEDGEEKEFTLKPSESYGDHNSDLLKKLPKDKIPEEAKAGMMLAMQMPDGKQIPAKVIEITDNEVTIDLNHPLAGKELTFKIKVVDITS